MIKKAKTKRTRSENCMKPNLIFALMFHCSFTPLHICISDENLAEKFCFYALFISIVLQFHFVSIHFILFYYSPYPQYAHSLGLSKPIVAVCCSTRKELTCVLLNRVLQFRVTSTKGGSLKQNKNLSHEEYIRNRLNNRRMYALTLIAQTMNSTQNV